MLYLFRALPGEMARVGVCVRAVVHANVVTLDTLVTYSYIGDVKRRRGRGASVAPNSIPVGVSTGALRARVCRGRYGRTVKVCILMSPTALDGRHCMSGGHFGYAASKFIPSGRVCCPTRGVGYGFVDCCPCRRANVARKRGAVSLAMYASRDSAINCGGSSFVATRIDGIASNGGGMRLPRVRRLYRLAIEVGPARKCSVGMLGGDGPSIHVGSIFARTGCGVRAGRFSLLDGVRGVLPGNR